MVIEKMVEYERSFRIFGVVRIPKDICVVLDILRIVDESYWGMIHDEVIVLENVSDQAYQFDALRVESRIEFLIYLHQSEQFRKLLFSTKDIQSSQSRELAIVKIDDFTAKLSLYFFQYKLCL